MQAERNILGNEKCAETVKTKASPDGNSACFDENAVAMDKHKTSNDKGGANDMGDTSSKENTAYDGDLSDASADTPYLPSDENLQAYTLRRRRSWKIVSLGRADTCPT